MRYQNKRAPSSSTLAEIEPPCTEYINVELSGASAEVNILLITFILNEAKITLHDFGL